MIILRQRHFSIGRRKMIEDIIKILDDNGVDDFDTSTRVTRENISVSVNDQGMVTIYLPREYEYSQYDIDDFVRRNLGSFYRTTTTLDRNIYIQKIGKPLGPDQVARLVEWIIDNEDFCTLITN